MGDNGAEMFPIKKGDIVFNHEQTEALLKNGHISGHGKAYADGTVGGGKLLHPDGRISSPLQPGTKLYDLIQKANVYFGNIDRNVEKLVPNSFYEDNEKMHEAANQISNISNITNNNRRDQVIHQEIHVTLPNVTNATSAESLLRDLESIGRKKFQVNW